MKKKYQKFITTGILAATITLTSGSFSAVAKETNDFRFEQFSIGHDETTHTEEYEAVLTDKNGTSWRLYPKAEKIADNVAKYGREGETDSFYIDRSGNLYMYGKKRMENVEDCVWSGTYTYILKKDGTLWEKAAGENGSCKQVKSGIKEIDEQRYLTTNGELYSYFEDIKTGEKEADKVQELSVGAWVSSIHLEDMGYQDKNGYYHSMVVDGQKIGDQPLSVEEVYEPVSWGSGERYIYLSTEDGKIWRAKEESLTEYPYRTFPKAELISDQVVFYDWNAGIFQTQDGTYYTLDGKTVKAPSETNPVVAKELDLRATGEEEASYQLVDTGKGSLTAVKDGKEVLNHVSDIYALLDYSYALTPPYRIYAVDEENKVWDITDTPKQILDVNDGSSSDLTGDVGDINQDGKINMKDARTALKAAVGSETLNENQKKLGDVDGDGKVGMKDARLILKYAVGSITEF